MTAQRIILLGLAAIVGLLFAAYAAVWLLGERIVGRIYETPPIAIGLSVDPAVIKKGERLADIAGCTGCHGADLNGKMFGDAPFVFRSVASNLARLADTYSDEDFARSIRHGVKPNGKSVIYMPSPSFFDMRDEDLSAIISLIRTKEDKGDFLPRSETRILGRVELLQGLFPPEASQIDHGAARRAYDFSAAVEHGEYLARLACSECHGLDFKGSPNDPGGAPDLVVASVYQLEEFRQLMRTGVALGGRDLELMDDIARSRFVVFTDAEIDALHAFLVKRAL